MTRNKTWRPAPRTMACSLNQTVLGYGRLVRRIVQDPLHLLHDEGSRLRRLTQATFLERSIDKHGDAYDYSLANYTGLTKFVTIICKIHGEFEQRAGDHFRFGCNELWQRAN